MATNTLGEIPPLVRETTRGHATASDVVRQILVVLALVGTIAVNALANILPFNGQTTGDIANRFPLFFVPAGYVFSIWSVIYLGLAAYAIYQVLPAQRDDPQLQRIAYPFVLSCIANSAWILFWHYEFFTLSVVAMLTLLSTLIVIYAQLYPIYPIAARIERWLVHIPFRIYLGWISVATIANATVLLYVLNWSGWGIAPATWAAIMVGVGTVLALLFGLGRRDAAYALVFVWAYVGLYVKYSDTPIVAWTALAAALVVAAAVVSLIWRNRRKAALPLESVT